MWGEPEDGLCLGLSSPKSEMEAGGTISLDLICKNMGQSPRRVFGFQSAYPRSLRVSPPKEHRPWIQLSFGDTQVLHPPDAFVVLAPGESIRTKLDLSFAFDRRGAGQWRVEFIYKPVRASGGLDVWVPGDAKTGITTLIVTLAKSLVDAGINATIESELDTALFSGESLSERLSDYGSGGAAFAARRIGRLLSANAESVVGWRALDALSLLGQEGIDAVSAARTDIPHAAIALGFAEEYLRHKAGHSPHHSHLPFITTLDRLENDDTSRGNFLLTWTAFDSPIHGNRQLQVLGKGQCIVTSRAAGAAVTSTKRAMLSPMQMKQLLVSLRYAAVWLLRPLRKQGMPDEPCPSLEIQLALGEPYARQIGMWNGEWRHGPGSQLADLLDRLCTVVASDSVYPQPV